MNPSVDLSRRTLLQAAVTVTAVGAGNTVAGTYKEHSTMITIPAFESTVTLKPLAFDPAY
ncbi:hypothetical protein Undi14_18015 [Undibacterium sp. 14-3-2]|uniref:hypothetical protein n=1 Tax=Undibacterium sp. 14-3-2 TaxID=2800129 RepID=UPI001907B45B|nr:hypothetical protein [Undibacterium sp. 14-3-2]MBK1891932.1 hypothetical protein [Undibacterium sp. 14-3-2]